MKTRLFYIGILEEGVDPITLYIVYFHKALKVEKIN